MIVSEVEKLEIKKLYGLINEQADKSEPQIKLDLAGTFGSGKYKLPASDPKLDEIIEKIREFKSKNQGNMHRYHLNGYCKNK